jgi:hypothetical protein
MRTRTLHTIAVCLTTAGLTVAVAGLHPAAPPLMTRLGILLVIAAGPLVVAAQSRREATHAADALAAARAEGYRLGLAHAALGLLNPPDGGCTAPTHCARGHLHAVADIERKAE